MVAAEGSWPEGIFRLHLTTRVSMPNFPIHVENGR